MKPTWTRREILSAGLVLPAAGLCAPASESSSPFSQARPESIKLTYRTLGRTGLQMTSLGFGCMTTSDSSVIERAADFGINLFDTTRAYHNGNNERMVGAALKKARPNVMISSKSQGRTKEALLKDLETSLQALGTDYLDIWYLHNLNEPAELTDDLLEAQRIAKQSGKIRFAGVSTHFNMDKMLAHIAKLGQTDVVLTTYNFAMRSVDVGQNANPDAPRTDMTQAIRTARKAGLGIVAMKTMAGGFSRVMRGDRLYGADSEALSKRLGREGVPVAAIKWALQNEAVDAAIVCMTSHEQFDENIHAMAEPYTEKEEKLLTTQLAGISSKYCRMCGHCSGVCEKGVPVPDVLRFLTYAEGYGQFALAREKFLEMPPPVRDIRCSDCSSCSFRCAYGVTVRDRMIQAQDTLA